MVRLLRLVFILTLVFVSGLVAIIGQTYHSTNRFSYLFKQADGSPCVALCIVGASPATMTFEQANQILLMSPALQQTAILKADVVYGAIYANRQMELYLRDDVYRRLSVTISIDFERGMPDFASDMPTMGELLVALGKPEQMGLMKVDFAENDPPVICNSILIYKQSQLIILSQPTKVNQMPKANCMTSLHQKISGISFTERGIGLGPLVSWPGFATDSYFQYLLSLQAAQKP